MKCSFKHESHAWVLLITPSAALGLGAQKSNNLHRCKI